MVRAGIVHQDDAVGIDLWKEALTSCSRMGMSESEKKRSMVPFNLHLKAGLVAQLDPLFERRDFEAGFCSDILQRGRTRS